MAHKETIVKTAGTLSGRPRIAGHRIGVSDVWLSYLRALEKLAIPSILGDFPGLTREEVLEALFYARTHVHEIEQEFREVAEAEREGDPIPPAST